MEPLAYRMRPKSLHEVVGQKHLLQKGHPLFDAIMEDRVMSMLLWGPPGVGKTSLASAIAAETKSHFVSVNAVTSGVKELREVIDAAQRDQMGLFRKRTLLFIDEIHRFNKAQQDFLLPFVERGIVTLIGATTENPSFEVNGALLSRLQVFVLKELTEEDIVQLLKRAVQEDEVFAHIRSMIKKEDIQRIAEKSFGDGRSALTMLEALLPYFSTLPEECNERKNTLNTLIQQKLLRYDKVGEEHYNIISALHKSMRDSDVDGSIYWAMRMLHSGEDPKYLVRRMIRFASEDIGLADPEALKLAIAVKENVIFVGMPESQTAIVQLAAYLAQAPKDNRCYVAVQKATKIIQETGPLPVPLHLRNAPTKLMKQQGYGKGYKYAHDYEDARVEQEHMPAELEGLELFGKIKI